ncbi:CHASE3 domain-containing protein [Kitasatospora sp. NPDC094019]|uniref:sensor histidine kinase n=1 Tax=Kitasatospora sp. NPDC094019 TaxID=3364091 RepID=UPI0038037C54
MHDDHRPPRPRSLSTWTTRRWLRVGAALSLTVLAALGLTGAWVLQRTETISVDLVDTRSPALTSSFRLEAAMLNQETGIRGYGLTGNPEFLQPYQQGLADQATCTTRLTELLPDDPEALDDLARVETAIADWQEKIARPIAAQPQGTPSPQATGLVTDSKASFDALRTAMTAQQDRLRADRAEARDALTTTFDLRNLVFTAIAAVVALLTVLVFEGLRRGITRPLEQLGADTRRITKGEFEHAIALTGPADLRQLSADVDSMRRRLVHELAFTEEARMRLDTQAADLQRSNAELEQFAYVASHDLQEPLRKVSSFTQLLQRRYGGQLDARADQYIGFAVDGANRMQTLINDLLDFSRVGRVLNTTDEVNLEETLDRTLDALGIAIQEAGADITHDPLPALVADSTQMGMLFQNLIGNAVKFHHPGRPPHIHITAEREGPLWHFAVTDDGIGIAPEFADKVFVIFQRLHTKEAFSGSGIGLAMCRKIVEFHGGTIAVDPDHSDGTRIAFTLAARPPQDPRVTPLTGATRAGTEAEPHTP